MDWHKFFDGVTFLVLAGGAVGALKYLVEYIRDNGRKRMEFYIALRAKYREHEGFGPIFEYLEKYDLCSDEEKRRSLSDEFLGKVERDTRSEFAAFLEDIAMMLKSGALKPPVAHYMFGYHAIACWKNDAFWSAGLRDTENDPYWALLKDFVCRMQAERKILETSPSQVISRLKV
jgi:hypothetical protein